MMKPFSMLKNVVKVHFFVVKASEHNIYMHFTDVLCISWIKEVQGSTHKEQSHILISVENSNQASDL